MEEKNHVGKKVPTQSTRGDDEKGKHGCILNKNKISSHSIRPEELLGEHQLKPEDAKKVQLEVLKFLSNAEKDI